MKTKLAIVARLSTVIIFLLSINFALHAQRVSADLEIAATTQPDKHVFTITVHNDSPYAAYVPQCKLKDQPLNVCASLIRLEKKTRAHWRKVLPSCHCGVMSSPPYADGVEIRAGGSRSVSYTTWGDVLPLEHQSTYRVELGYWISKQDFDQCDARKWITSASYKTP